MVFWWWQFYSGVVIFFFEHFFFFLLVFFLEIFFSPPSSPFPHLVGTFPSGLSRDVPLVKSCSSCRASCVSDGGESLGSSATDGTSTPTTLGFVFYRWIYGFIPFFGFFFPVFVFFFLFPVLGCLKKKGEAHASPSWSSDRSKMRSDFKESLENSAQGATKDNSKLMCFVFK